MNNQTTYHQPVLLNESIEGLHINPNGVYVDATFGGGGHSEAILKQLNKGKLVAFDMDTDALANAQKLSEMYGGRFIFVHHNFCFLTNFLRYHQIDKVDGILADLGVSSHQFDDAERGFSFRFDAELDMRMNRKAGVSAKDVLNTYPFKQLIVVFSNYGEVQRADKLAAKICNRRDVKPFETVDDLVQTSTEFLLNMMPRHKLREKENQWFAKIFQALRIEVNKELENLKKFLSQSTEILQPEGRLSVITYHSLEDRLVKNFIKTGNFEGEEIKDIYGNLIAPLDAVNRKVIIPTDQEIEANNRARSAKLRIAQRTENKKNK